MDAWPASLPQYPLEEGYERRLADGLLRTEMDVGPAKTRRRSAAEPEALAVSVRLSAAQLPTFRSFVRVTLQDGAKPFSWIDWETGLGAVYWLTAPPVITPLSGGRWRAEMRLETQP